MRNLLRLPGHFPPIPQTLPKHRGLRWGQRLDEGVSRFRPFNETGYEKPQAQSSFTSRVVDSINSRQLATLRLRAGDSRRRTKLGRQTYLWLSIPRSKTFRLIPTSGRAESKPYDWIDISRYLTPTDRTPKYFHNRRYIRANHTWQDKVCGNTEPIGVNAGGFRSCGCGQRSVSTTRSAPWCDNSR